MPQHSELRIRGLGPPWKKKTKAGAERSRGCAYQNELVEYLIQWYVWRLVTIRRKKKKLGSIGCGKLGIAHKAKMYSTQQAGRFYPAAVIINHDLNHDQTKWGDRARKEKKNVKVESGQCKV